MVQLDYTILQEKVNIFIENSKCQMIELLQEFLFIPLDITKKIYEYNSIRNKLEAWLCLNTEKVMNMFSKELMELDRNTVQFMIDEMQDEIDSQKVQLQEKDAKLQEKDTKIAEMEAEIARLKAQQ